MKKIHKGEIHQILYSSGPSVSLFLPVCGVEITLETRRVHNWDDVNCKQCLAKKPKKKKKQQ
jgi:hypothetical protein